MKLTIVVHDAEEGGYGLGLKMGLAGGLGPVGGLGAGPTTRTGTRSCGSSIRWSFARGWRHGRPRKPGSPVASSERASSSWSCPFLADYVVTDKGY